MFRARLCRYTARCITRVYPLKSPQTKKIKRLCDQAKNLLISTNDNEPESDDENRVMDESADEF